MIILRCTLFVLLLALSCSVKDSFAKNMTDSVQQVGTEASCTRLYSDNSPDAYRHCYKALQKAPGNLALNYYTAASLALFAPDIDLTKANLLAAISSINQVISKRKLPTDWVDSFMVRAMLYDLQGDFKSALKDMDKCIAIDPKYGVYYRKRARVLLNYGKNDLAMKDLIVAKGLEPREPQVLRLILETLFKEYSSEGSPTKVCGNCEKLFKYYDELYKMEGSTEWNQSYGLYFRGPCWACLNDKSKAEADLIKARSVFKQSGGHEPLVGAIDKALQLMH